MRAGWALLAFAASCLVFVRGLVAAAPFLLYVDAGLVAYGVLAAGAVLFFAVLALGAGSGWLGARGVVWPFFAFIAMIPFSSAAGIALGASLAAFNFSSAFLWYIPTATFFAVLQLITAFYYAKVYKATGVEEFRRAGKYVVIGALAAALYPPLLATAAYGDILAAKTAAKKALGK